VCVCVSVEGKSLSRPLWLLHAEMDLPTGGDGHPSKY